MSRLMKKKVNMSAWAVTPMFILRKYALLDALQSLPPGRFLELGAGTGTLTQVLVERGFHGICNDISTESLAAVAARFAQHQVTTTSDLHSLDDASFDFVFAFEVLEHIEDDHAALRAWLTKLKRGGHLLLSVPSHQRKFGRDDRLVGHVRRYERSRLLALVEANALHVLQLSSYAFPLGIVSRHAANLAYWMTGADVQTTSTGDAQAIERSKQSGMSRPLLTRLLAPLFREAALMPFVHLQRAFYQRDWGDGYVLLARKVD